MTYKPEGRPVVVQDLTQVKLLAGSLRWSVYETRANGHEPYAILVASYLDKAMADGTLESLHQQGFTNYFGRDGATDRRWKTGDR